MTDDLIKALQKELRGAETELSAKRQRIAHLEQMFHGWREEAIKANARIAELEAENAKLRTALKPFADVAEEVNAINLCYRDIEIWVAVADLRAARAALGEKE